MVLRAIWATFKPKEIKLGLSNIKKLIIFSQKEAFVIFPKMEPCTFQSKIEKQKKFTPRKFLMLQETKSPQNFLRFLKRKLFYISGNCLYFRKQKPRKKTSVST